MDEGVPRAHPGAASASLVRQYDAYNPFSISMSTARSLGENIADLAVAYVAYGIAGPRWCFS